MDTRVDGASDDYPDDTWVDERTLPDFDATTVDGEVWPRPAPVAAAPAWPRSEFRWR